MEKINQTQSQELSQKIQPHPSHIKPPFPKQYICDLARLLALPHGCAELFIELYGLMTYNKTFILERIKLNPQNQTNIRKYQRKKAMISFTSEIANDKVSVIIPAYNCEKTIKETIDSVLSQTFTNFELIIINDGSTDSTLDILINIKDSRIRVFSSPHVGASVSRNHGLARATAEFISFLDADDIWLPEKLASQIKALKNNPTVSVAYSWTDYINENSDRVLSGSYLICNGNVYEQLLLGNFLENGSNPLISRKALIETQGFDESLTAAQDWDMWLRLAHKFNFICVPSVQILYRIHPNSLSSNLIRQEKLTLQVLKSGYERIGLALQENWYKSLTNLYKYLTCKALQEPYTRYKARLALRYLYLFFMNDADRLSKVSFTLKLLAKTTVIMFFKRWKAQSKKSR